MSDSEKPFVCSEPGCRMSFINEDHLTVHKKKHDMMLNLGINNKNNFFIADQTPTPTRFIRSCEEVGLFQDLHNDNDNDNPFEETFRRAVEAGKSCILSVPEVEDSDTLHTPNVIIHTPHISQERSITSVSTKNQVIKTRNASLTESSTIIQTVSSKEIKVDDLKKHDQKSPACPGTVGTLSNENMVIQAITDSSSSNDCVEKTRQIPLKGTEMQLMLKTLDGQVLKLVTAPIVKVHSNDSLVSQVTKQKIDKGSIATNYDHNKPDAKKVQGAVVKMKLKQVLTKSGVTTTDNKKIPSSQNENKPKEPLKDKSKRSTINARKQEVLERNRASSMRARAKKKAWVENLKLSLEAADHTNSNLQNQVKTLLAQVERLKTLLLAHKDCPVTKAMEKGNGIVIGSKVMTINHDDVEPLKRPSSGKSSSPKKKLMIMSATKNPMILPKPDKVANTITLHGVDGVKTIPAVISTPLIAQPSNGNRILLRPENGTVSLVQENVEFRVVENFERNIASEATNTQASELCDRRLDQGV